MDTITFPEKDLLLRPVTVSTAADIKELMHQCYPPVYQHLWVDQGQWYVDKTFNKATVLAELQEKEAPF